MILLLGAARPRPGLEYISQARSRGLAVWLTDTAENLEHAPEVVAAADIATALSYRDVEACVSWASAQAKVTPFLGVFGFREYAVEAVAAVAEALGLPGNSLDKVRCVRSKLACRHALRERGFRQPALQLCSNLPEALEFLSTYPPGPWIVKPPAAMGSLGVSLIRDAADLKQAMQHLADSRRYLAEEFGQQGIAEESFAHITDSSFLIECFQSGEEFSAEGVFLYGQPHVLTVTAKITLGPPHFVEVGHSMPAELEPNILQTIKETVEKALHSLGLKWGHFHVEFWLDRDLPVLGEIHVRPGGDYIHFMTQHVTGIELYGVLFDQLLGRSINLRQYQAHLVCGQGEQRGAAIRFMTLPPGQITAINGWENVVSDPDCLLAELRLGVGDRVGPVYSSSDRVGFVLVTGRTSREAIRTAERLTSTIQMQVSADQLQENRN